MASNTINYEVKVLNVEDTPRVQDFLKKFFYRDEPLNVYVDLPANEGAIKELEKYSTLPIKHNCSLIAIDQSGKTIGVCLNKIRMKTSEEDDVPFIDPVFSKIAGLLGYIDNEANIFEKFPNVDTFLQIDVISVDDTYRGQGIAKKLIDGTRAIAKERGIKLIKVDCTSAYSAKAAARLGFHSIYELKYADYKVNGDQVFKPELPHTGVAVYVQMIDGKVPSPKL